MLRYIESITDIQVKIKWALIFGTFCDVDENSHGACWLTDKPKSKVFSKIVIFLSETNLKNPFKLILSIVIISQKKSDIWGFERILILFGKPLHLKICINLDSVEARFRKGLIEEKSQVLMKKADGGFLKKRRRRVDFES